MHRHPVRVKEAASLLRNRSFFRLWAAQFSTITVVYGLGLAGAVLIEEETHSSTQTGLVILSSILPAFLASLVAGAAVDRWGRLPSIVTSYLARVLIGLAFWAATRLLPIGPAVAAVYALNAAGAISAQFALSAELALLPELVDRHQLMGANALIQLGTLVAEGLGMMVLSPLVIKLAGAPAMGLVGAGLCLLGLALVAGLTQGRAPLSPAEDGSPVWTGLGADLQAGWRAIATDRLLRLVAAQATLAATLLLVLLSLVPGLAARYLGLGVEDAPLLMLPGGVGFLLGASLVGRWEGRLSRPAWIAAGLAALGLSICLLGVLSGGGGHLGVILPLVLGLGLALALVLIPARTVLQEQPPAALRGRVIAAQLALANAAAVIPLLVGGALADQLGIRPVMGVLGLVAMGAGAIGLHHVQR